MKPIQNYRDTNPNKQAMPKSILEKIDDGLKDVDQGRVTEASEVLKNLREKYVYGRK